MFEHTSCCMGIAHGNEWLFYSQTKWSVPLKITSMNCLFEYLNIELKLLFTVFPVKLWTPEKISGMFIVSRPIRCEMKPQKITFKPQQGSVTTWYETASWLFLLQEIFNFPFGSPWKSYFLTTNQHQSLDSVCSETKLPNKPKSDCKLWKFITLQVDVLGEGFSATKKIRIENHQSQLTSMTFWTVHETNTEKHRLWLAHFFLLSDSLSSSVSDPAFLINFAFP